MTWREPGLGSIKRVLAAIVFVGLVIAVVGFIYFVFAGSPDKVMPLNNLLAVGDVLVLLTVFIVPSLSKRSEAVINTAQPASVKYRPALIPG
jgi:hypothetical protein